MARDADSNGERGFDSLSQFFVRLLVRRAKLDFVSRRQVPVPEALARHRVPSVASLPVTSTAKRTQGGDGPQCESVKGLSPVMNVKSWVPTPLAMRKATSTEPIRLWLWRTHRGRRPGHVTKAESGTREVLWVLPRMGVERHNRPTGRKLDDL